MTLSFQHELADALRERLRIIGDHDWRDRDPAGHLAALQEASERLSGFARALPPGTSGQLRHYLVQCSYQKALALLEGGNPEG